MVRSGAKTTLALMVCRTCRTDVKTQESDGEGEEERRVEESMGIGKGVENRQQTGR